MKPTRLPLAVSFAVMAYAVPVAGQDRHRAEVFAGGGVSRMGGDEGSLGSGPSVVAGFGYRVTSRLALEIDLTRAQHDRNIAGGPLEGTATGVFGNLLYHFGEGRTQVFVAGSVGMLNSDITHTYPAAGGTQTITSDENDFAWGGGGGVKVFLTPHVSLRPQFRIVFSEQTGVMGQATASVAVGFHW
jgi:Outer membrane protein beta-barrel domain